jgi:hypothetical protein
MAVYDCHHGVNDDDHGVNDVYQKYTLEFDYYFKVEYFYCF